MVYAVSAATRIAETESQLTDLIYGSLIDQAQWQPFVTAVREIYPNGRSTLLLHDRSKKQGMYAITSGMDHGWTADYQRTYSALNPWMENIGKRPLGLGARAELTVSRQELLATEFYNSFLQPQELLTGIGLTVMQENNRLLALSVVGADADDGDLQTLSDLFTRLAPHLRRVMQLHRRNGRDPLGNAGPLIDSLDVGIAVVGQDGRVASASPMANRLLAKGRAIRLDIRRRLLIDCDEAMEMLGLLLAQDWQWRNVPRARSFVVRDRDDIPYRITLIAGGRDVLTTFFDGPTVFVIVEDLDRPLRLTPEVLRILYGLSPSEAQLMTVLADGATLAQASQMRGISHETARSQLKNACAKLGVSRQADAIRIVCRAGYGIIAPDAFG